LYVNDLVHGQKVLSGREAVVLESLSRYHNPDFIKAMKAEGYDGARYFSRIVDNQYGWNVVSDVVTADDWKKSAEIYLDDKYRLGLREFFNRHNPHALQNIASRVLETHRKGLQKLDPKTLELAARVYVETVAQHGPACASHICANPELATLAEKVAGASHQLADGTLERFRSQLKQAGNVEMTKALASAGGASDQPARASQPVEGQVLTSVPPSPPPPAAEAKTSVSPPPPVPPNRPYATQTPPSDSAEAEPPDKTRLVTLLAAVLCLAAFTSGMVWRAARHRRIG
jgi:cobaltochelatase CobN